MNFSFIKIFIYGGIMFNAEVTYKCFLFVANLEINHIIQTFLNQLTDFYFCKGSTVFYPSDAVSCARAVELAANTKGICYIRTSRPNTAVLYENNQEFKVKTLFYLTFIFYLFTYLSM